MKSNTGMNGVGEELRNEGGKFPKFCLVTSQVFTVGVFV